MKRTWTGAFVAMACALTVGLAAQGTPSSGAQTQTSKAASSSDKVTITGCLDKATGGSAATGTSGTTSSSASSAKFVLKNAMAGSGSSTGSSATGTSGARSASSAASTYNLSGDDSKLSPHVGHKVEITGSVEGGAGSSSSTSSASSASSASSTPTLKVESVKMVASSCQ